MPKKRKKKGRKVSRPTKRQRERQEAKRQKKLEQDALERMLAQAPSYTGYCADCGKPILSGSDFTFKREMRTYVKVDEETGEEVSRKKEAVIVGMYHFYCGPNGRIMKRWVHESREWSYIADEMLSWKRKWNDSGRRWPAYARPL